MVSSAPVCSPTAIIWTTIGGKTSVSPSGSLMVVGMLMLNAITKIDFDDLTELVSAFTTVIVMVFTFNIANGLTAGLVLYPIMKVLAGRARELRAGTLVLAALCALYYLFGIPH